jgi:YVTN family beta-propeller protein
MVPAVLLLLLQLIVPAGGAPKSPSVTAKLPPCAVYCEWLDAQKETGSFYDGLPETDGSPRPASSTDEPPAGLPFGFPDSVTGVIEGIPAPVSVSVDPSGLYLYVMTAGDEGLLVVRLSSMEVIRSTGTADSSATDGGIAVPCPVVRVHPRGTYVYVTNPADSTVSVFLTEDGSAAAVVKVWGRPSDIGFSPVGSRAYVPCRDSGRIFVLE